MKKRYLAFLLLLAALASLLAGCSAKSQAPEADFNAAPQAPSGGFADDAKQEDLDLPDAPMDTPMETPEPGSLDSAANQTETGQTERKIIRNADFSMETLNYDKTIQNIQALAEQSGGYVESSQTTGPGAAEDYYHARWASFTLRIPAQGLDSFAESLAQYGSVTESFFYTDEVTDYYYDTEAHLKSLQLQEQRLLEILSKADTLSDVVALENSLAEVRYQIESLQGSLRRLDSLIALSTVNISVQEVYEYSPEQGRAKGLGERISAEFSRSTAAIRRTAEDFLVFALGNILTILPVLALLILAVILLRRHRRKKLLRKEMKEKPESPPEQEQKK